MNFFKQLPKHVLLLLITGMLTLGLTTIIYLSVHASAIQHEKAIVSANQIAYHTLLQFKEKIKRRLRYDRGRAR